MAMPDEAQAPPPVAHLETKARLLLLLMVLMVAGAVGYLMYARGAFERTQQLVLIADDSEGIVVGMDMTFSGFPIGRVGRIELSPDGNARIIVNVPRRDAHWLRASSVFTMENGLVGGPRFRAFSGVLTDPPLPDGAERKVLRGDAAAEIPKMIASVRDLVNTPAEHMGPEELAAAARMVARQHGAKFRQVVGDALLRQNFPAIHAVGRASTRAPRLIELNWGKPKDPLLCLVGKGVCFDSGGLDIKGAEGMRQMKKDMGGAANALGLAALVMALKLPVRLQVLLPAVENAIAGNAYRPGDVFKTRKGLHIEIGNTDAEGRVILCDALAYAAEGKPALIIDLATLTGAARVALGPQLPALFCRQMQTARQLVDLGLQLDDPLWHMPLWAPYKVGIESPIGDIVNTGRNAMGGAINAALFLEYFVPEQQDWLHIDLFAWNDGARAGRPVGGEAQTIRTLLAYLEQRFAGRKSG